MRIGYDRETLAAGLELMESIGWSSTPAEQGQLPSTQRAQHHRGYSQDTLRARAMVASMAPLLSPDPGDGKRRSLLQRLRRVERRQPQKCTGRQAYFKDLLVRGREAITREQGRASKVQKHLMKKHGARWQQLLAQTKEVFEQVAAQSAAERMEENRCEAERVRQELRLLQERSRQSEDSGSWRLTGCKYDRSEVQAFDNLWSDGRFATSQVDALRAAALQDLQPPSEGFQKALLQYEPPPPDARPKPAWLKPLTSHRGFFCDTILKLSRPGQVDPLVQYVHAMQNPQVVFFVDIVARDLPAYQPEDYGEQLMSKWRFEYDWIPGAYTYSDDEVYVDAAVVGVKSDVVFLEGTRLGTDSEWRPLADVLKSLPPVASAAGQAQPCTRRRAPTSDMLEAEPWLLDYLDMSNRPQSQRPTSAAPRGSAEPDNDRQGDEADADVDRVFDELESLRVATGRHHVAPKANFSWDILGGLWTAANKKVSCDAFQAKACTKAATRLCKQYRMNTSARFSLTWYGEHACAILCEYWVAKMSHLYSVWEDAGCLPDFVFGSQAVDSFEEPADFAGLAGSATKTLKRRTQDLRSLGPSLPQ